MYSIGELSRITGLAVTALHYYDRLGILVPEARDPSSSYRYYSEKQLLQVQLINNMKMLGIPLADIREILKAEDLSFLREKMQEAMHRVELQMEAVKSINEYLSRGESLLSSLTIQTGGTEAAEPAVELRAIPRMLVLAVCESKQCMEYHTFVQKCSELQKKRIRLDLYQSGALLAILHENSAELCMPVYRPEKRRLSELRFLARVRTASLVAMGTDVLAADAQRKLKAWAEENQYIAAGDPMVEYLLEPCDILAEGTYLMRCHLPIVEKPR